MIALGTGWLAVLVMTAAERGAAVRLVMPAVVASALWVFGWVLVQRGAAPGEVFKTVGMLGGLGVVALALGRCQVAWAVALLRGMVVPLGAFGLGMPAGGVVAVAAIGVSRAIWGLRPAWPRGWAWAVALPALVPMAVENLGSGILLGAALLAWEMRR